ncbi:MAG TPA: hypothetical protein PLV92_23590, partial [Pirellulaceae bacterium]|nr:hypothetical protein [Pirellulaceae bacterium]
MALLDFGGPSSTQLADKTGRNPARIEAPAYAINSLTAPPFFKPTPLATNVQPVSGTGPRGPAPGNQAARTPGPSTPKSDGPTPTALMPGTPTAERPAAKASDSASTADADDSKPSDDAKPSPTAAGTGRRPSIDSRPKRSPDDFAPAARHPAPDENSIAETLVKVRELYRAEYDSLKNAAGKSAFAAKLAKRAREVSDDPASQYVLLDEARRLALDAAQLADAANWIDELAASFEVDPHQLKVAAARRVHDLMNGPPPAPTVARVQMIDATLAASMLAVESRRYIEADQLAQIAVAQSKTQQSIDVEVRRRAQSIADSAASLLREFDETIKAEERLKAAPDEGEANFVAGRFRCFRAEQWDLGLPLLTKSGIPPLAEAARLDLAAGENAIDRNFAAAAWERASESMSGTDRRECLERAYRGYT